MLGLLNEDGECEKLMQRPLYRVAQVRALDAAAMAAGTPGFELMQRAAQAAWMALRRYWRWAREVIVVAGHGNNGGDGLVLAALAKRAGWPVRVLLAVEPGRFQGDARQAHALALESAVPMTAWEEETLEADSVLVDALLGSGLNGPVRARQAGIIDWMNRQAAPVLALDVPSGLNADTGRIQGVAVHAERTLTFVADKPGLHTADGPACAGAVLVANLDLPAALYATEDAAADLLPRALPFPMPGRSANSHKGQFGHVLCLGGQAGMAGAIRMAAEASLRSGAGLVSVACASESILPVACGRPELMVQEGDADTLQHHRATVLALGPGLGQSRWSRQLAEAVWRDDRPLVVDADALAWLPAKGFAPRPVVLTPHPGEAARMLGCTVTDVQQDRLQTAQKLAERWQATVVLKGAGTVIAQPGKRPAIAPLALPAMSGAGFGDVLTGIIAALLAQGLSTWEAACNGVMAHGLAAEKAAGSWTRGLLATDLLPHLPEVLA